MIDWNEQPIDIKELCKTPKLSPILAKLDDGSKQNKGTVYLLYVVRKCLKVTGNCLKWTNVRGEPKLTENGAGFVIPITYPGWFQFVAKGKDRGALPLHTIDQVAASKANVFLVHRTISGFEMNDTGTTTRQRNTKEPVIQQRKVVELKAGEVLAADTVYEERPPEKKRHLCPSLFGSKKSDVKLVRKYLQCTDTAGRRILLPFGTKGQFSLIGNKPIGAETEISESNYVYQINDLVRRNDFPQTFRLVYGIKPPVSKELKTEPTFTGIIKLSEKYMERSLIACQISPSGKLAFLEFPSDSGVRFLLARDWEAAKGSVYTAVDFCQKYVNSYKNEIQPLLDCIPDSLMDTMADDDSVFGSGTLRRQQPMKLRTMPAFDEDTWSSSTAEKDTTQTAPIRTFKSEITEPLVLSGPLKSRVAPPSGHTSVSNSSKNANNLTKSSTTPCFRTTDTFPNSKNNKLVPISIDICADIHRQSKTVEINRSMASTAKPNPSPMVDPNERRKHTPSSQIRDRKLPPLPPGCSGSCTESGMQRELFPRQIIPVDPVYEQIPTQRFHCLDPTESAPASPAPKLESRRRRENRVASPHAYDAGGYLIPAEYRNKHKEFEYVSRMLRQQRNNNQQRTSDCCEEGLKTYSDPGWTNSAFDLRTLSDGFEKTDPEWDEYDKRRFRQSIPDMQNMDYDVQRLQSFLEDSLAELNRKHSAMLSHQGMFSSNRNNSGLTRRRKKSPKTRDGVDLPRSPEEVDTYLNTIFDCEDEDTEDDIANVAPPFYRAASSGFCGRYQKASSRASYNGLDSLSKADSGIASRQSTIQRIPKDWSCRSIGETSWEPPEKLASLTVEEVLMSLRYIGIKDQIVKSFDCEKVDGKLLCDMNDHLLSEGFPDMNSLEKKKVLDFINGWRPKRMLFV